MKLFRGLIISNIYISVAAVALTVGTQIQLGMEPQWHPYLFIIFFATLLEYNLHRFITVITNKEALNSEKHKWVRDNLKEFYALVFLSVAGFICVAFLAKLEVLITLAPIGLLTLLYSIPIFGKKKTILRLREIPYMKIFVISFVWSASTILLPIIQSGLKFNMWDVVAMLAERFLFVFAITIPFDIRDTEVDQQAKLKTLPLLLSKNTSLLFAYFSLVIFFVIAFFHYWSTHYYFIIWPLGISAITTFIFLKSKKIQSLPYYHYGILDGTMLLQGLLVIAFYYFTIY